MQGDHHIAALRHQHSTHCHSMPTLSPLHTALAPHSSTHSTAMAHRTCCTEVCSTQVAAQQAVQRALVHYLHLTNCTMRDWEEAGPRARGGGVTKEALPSGMTSAHDLTQPREGSDGGNVVPSLQG